MTKENHDSARFNATGRSVSSQHNIAMIAAHPSPRRKWGRG
jgi:hypothetical protein